MLFSGKKNFLVLSGYIFGVNEYTSILDTFLESSGRIKFKLLLQLKKTLTKKWWNEIRKLWSMIFLDTLSKLAKLPHAFEHSIFINTNFFHAKISFQLRIACW